MIGRTDVERDEEDAIGSLEAVYCGVLEVGDFISLLEPSINHIGCLYATSSLLPACTTPSS